MKTRPVSLALLFAAVMLSTAGCSEKKTPTPPTPPPDRPKAVQPVAAPTPTPAPQADASPFGTDEGVIKELRRGGYVIALRHARTDMNQKDYEGLKDYNDCSKQRNLSPEGRDEAKKLGEWIRAINFPIAEVLSSPFCRNRETAELAFGKFTVNMGCMGEDDGSVAARNALLGASPPAGTNIVLVTHKHSMSKSLGNVGLDTLNEGGAAVIKPLGESKFELLHFIPFEDWARLAEAAKTVK